MPDLDYNNSRSVQFFTNRTLYVYDSQRENAPINLDYRTIDISNSEIPNNTKKSRYSKLENFMVWLIIIGGILFTGWLMITGQFQT